MSRSSQRFRSQAAFTHLALAVRRVDRQHRKTCDQHAETLTEAIQALGGT
ncbi:hypothetical protein [Streptomyces sp. V1I1]|nr:hypothetical protein [Streptomyces sp. V1I1]MDQ0941816.1 hypothetical protein [Streptomyces sp. V1I1]